MVYKIFYSYEIDVEEKNSVFLIRINANDDIVKKCEEAKSYLKSKCRSVIITDVKKLKTK